MAIATTKMIDNVIDGTTLVQIAQRANQDGSGNSIANSYARTNGNYPNMTVGNATNADTATTATKATQDGGGNNIQQTYATKEELTDGLAGKQPTGNYALQNGTYPDMTVGNATNADSADSAETATTATTANHVQNALTFGNKSYNGSSAQEITADKMYGTLLIVLRLMQGFLKGRGIHIRREQMLPLCRMEAAITLMSMAHLLTFLIMHK